MVAPGTGQYQVCAYGGNRVARRYPVRNSGRFGKMRKHNIAIVALLTYVCDSISSQDTEVSETQGPEYVRLSSESSVENEWAQSLFAKPLPSEEENLKVAVLQFLAENAVEMIGLGLSTEEVALQDVQYRPSDDRVYAYLNVSRSGIPLLNSTIRLAFVESTRRLLSFKMPVLNAWEFTSPLPNVGSDSGLLSATKLIPDSVKTREPLLVYYPMQSEKVFMLSWDIELASTGMGAFRVLVNAISGEPLEVIAGSFELDATGTVRGYSTPVSSRLPDYSGNPPQIQSVPNIQVTIQPGNGSGNTNSSGAFSISTTQQTVTATTVVNVGTFMAAVQDSPLASDQASGLTNIQLVFNDVPSDPNRKRFTAQLNAWQFVALGRQFLDTIYTRTAIPLVANPIFESNCSAYPGNPPAHVRWKIQLRPNHGGTCIVNGVASYYEDCLPTIERSEERRVGKEWRT